MKKGRESDVMAKQDHLTLESTETGYICPAYFKVPWN